MAVIAAVLLALPAAAAAQEPPVPAQIEQAEESGDISAAQADLYRAYALGQPEKLPAKYRSRTPWDGTLMLLEVRRSLNLMGRGTARERLSEALAAANTTCSDRSGSLANTHNSTHFNIDYDSVAGGLTVQDYADSLERSWSKEVTQFGWAAPPVPSNPPPGNRYHVRVENLGAGLYGFVSSTGTYAGSVGNNPATPWNEGDAYASCMVLNSDYSGFPAPSPQISLDATTAHEFNHSIQFGYGALTGSNTPDEVFIEAGASWMEDEVHDNANDNYSFLWPDFAESMGAYEESLDPQQQFPYSYWVVFRGLTEPFGTGSAGGGEDVMQRFWEETSKATGNNLTALQTGLAAKGTTLADAFHAFAIAARFNRGCGGGHLSPYCLEEGPGYVDAALAPAFAGPVAIGTPYPGAVRDDYTISWVRLPTSGSYDIQISNVESGGQLRTTVACDTGSTVELLPLPVVGTGGAASAELYGFNRAACLDAFAVITNQAQTAPDPSASQLRDYTLTTSVASAQRTLGVTKAGLGAGTVTSEPAGINCGQVCLGNYSAGHIVTLRATATPGSVFAGWAGACSGSSSICTVTLDEAAGVTANFTPPAALPPSSGNSTTPTGGSPAAAPAPAPVPAPPVRAIDVRRPVIGSLRLAGRRIRAARSGRRSRGIRVRYRLSETATVTVTVDKLKRTRSGRRRYVRLRGRISLRGRAGRNAFTFRGRIGRLRLRPGRYRLVLSAKDAAGHVSAKKRASFRVVR